jgi:hypothetical protein
VILGSGQVFLVPEDVESPLWKIEIPRWSEPLERLLEENGKRFVGALVADERAECRRRRFRS